MRSANLLILVGATVLLGCGRDSDLPSLNLGSIPGSGSAQEWFEDITAKSGLNFHHQTGTNFFMPDQVGSGVALLDFNGDGRLDIYFLQNAGPESAARNQLFQQQPDGRFQNVSAGSGADLAGRGMGVIAGDVNNDGRPDLVITEYGALRLLQNWGDGKFREVTQEANLDNPRWGGPASFIDFDRDGRLDLVVGNYLDYDPTQICHDAHGRRDFCAPQAFPPTSARLWRNVTPQPGATPRFEDETVRSGVFRPPGVAMGVICADFDGDRWSDIFFADDGRPNRLFINQRDGTFREQAAMRGLAYNAMGKTAANMGVAFADFDANGMPDLFVTHLAEEFHSLFKQDARGVFSDAIGQSGLQKQAWRGTGFGAVAADFDLDGAPDLAFVNGLVRRAIPGQTPVMAGVSDWWAPYAQRAQLFANLSGQFHDISPANSIFCGEAAIGRSLAVGDLDNDGSPDLVLGGIAGPAKIYRNVAPKRGHWLKIRIVLPEHGHRDAIGAELVVRAEARSWWLIVQPATSYFSSNDPVLHVGLGAAAMIDGIDVIWPDGELENFPGMAADQLIVLKKGGSAQR